MSGHSHWKTIKYKKGVTDIKRGKIFTKLARLISAAAKQGGLDPAFNPRLKLAIEQARSFNMPNENIERAVKRGGGGEEEENLEEILLEGFGPEGTALLIFAITNNKNRTLGEVRRVLGEFNGKLGEGGSVKWLFDQKGIVQISQEQNPSLSLDDLEMRAIDAGAIDTLRQEGGFLDVFTAPVTLDSVKNKLTAEGVKVESISVDWIPKNLIHLPPEKKDVYQKLLDELDELDDVQDVYANTTFDM